MEWDNYNEGQNLIESVKRYQERSGYYPASVHADAIYRNRDNLNFCKIHGIRLSGPKLGRPPKVVSANDKKLARQDARDKITVEGAFGVAKRRYSLGLIMTRLQETSESVIAMQFLVINLAQAKRGRSEDSTKGKIDRQLRNLNLHKVVTYRLQPLTLKSVGPGGKEKKINSFRIEYTIDETALKKQGSLDGVSCFLTNSQSLKPEQVILAYRRKNKAEEAFREIKRYLQVRPFYLAREEKIRAHVCICVLGYLLLNTLEEQLSHFENPLSCPDALAILGRCQLNRIGSKGSETYVESITEPAPEQLELLRELGLSYLVEAKFVDQLLEHSAM